MSVEIDRWAEMGIKQGYSYMAILCDTFSYEDYPVYFKTKREMDERVKNPGGMQRVIETKTLVEEKSGITHDVLKDICDSCLHKNIKARSVDSKGENKIEVLVELIPEDVKMEDICYYTDMSEETLLKRFKAVQSEFNDFDLVLDIIK